MTDRLSEVPDHPGHGGHDRPDAEQHDGPLDFAPSEAEKRLFLSLLTPGPGAPPGTAALDDELCTAAALVELPDIVEHVTLKLVGTP